MKNELERAFLRCGRRKVAIFTDDIITLIPREYSSGVSRLGGAKSMVMDIIERESSEIAGEIALRIGDSDSLYYLGHIGYHIDPPYRGRHMALRACRLSLELLHSMGMRSIVITTDIDNIPSIKTCLRLGCTLESTVNVPKWCQVEFMISAVKRRYVYEHR